MEKWKGGDQMRKRVSFRLASIILIFFLSCLLSSCGKKQVTNTNDKIIIRCVGYAHPQYDRFRKEQALSFEKINPKVKVNYDPVPGSGYSGRLMTQIVGDTAPDIFFVPPGSVHDYSKRGALLDLTPYLKKYAKSIDGIYSSIMRAVTFDGKVWALPGNANTDALFYNRKLFREAGLPYPIEQLTWSELMEPAKKLTKRDNRGRAIQFGACLGNQWVLSMAFGPKLWSEDGKKSTINNPQMKEAIEYIKDLRYKYRIIPNQADFDAEGAIEMFGNNRIAMYPYQRWMTAVIREKENLDWALAPFPRGRKATNWLSFNAIGVYAKTKYPEVAVDMLLHMISPDSIKHYIQFGDSIPIRNSGIEHSFFLNEPKRPKGENQVYLDGLEYALTTDDICHPNISYDEMNTIVWREVEAYWLGKVSAEIALAEAETKLNELLAQKQ